ncbi:MAG TPA: hypothetical protein VIV40_34235 [Kofleriaceae bacterium]
MAKLSTAAWVVHDLGLAASVGGTLFGRAALQPALYKIGLPEERDLVSADAWQRFSWINVLGHAAFATPWLVGRTMLSGKEVSANARSLTMTKDILVAASVATGVASVVIGRWLGKRNMEGRGAQAVKEGERFGHSEQEIKRTSRIKRAVGLLGMANLLAVAGVGIVTTLLAMEGSKSARFAPLSRFLP